MKNKCLYNYIKLFIKEKYIINDDDLSWFRLYLNSYPSYINSHVIFGEKRNEFNIECDSNKNINFLKLPVLKIRILIYTPDGIGKIENISIDETEDLLTGKPKYIIHPKISTMKERYGTDIKWLLMIDCCELDKEYSESFLYDENIIRPEIYETLCEYGNTVLSRNNYDKAIDYIKNNKNDFKSLNDDPHTILELSIDIITKSTLGTHRIRYVNDSSSAYYIIETRGKHDKNI